MPEKYTTKKLKIFNKIFPSVKGHSLIELEDDLRTICSILSLQLINDDERPIFKCLQALHVSYIKESLDYIIYKVSLAGRILILLVDASEPCQYTHCLPWCILDNNKWVYIDRDGKYPRLSNPFQKHTNIFDFDFYKMEVLNNQLFRAMAAANQKHKEEGIV